MRNKIKIGIEEYVAMNERIGAKLNNIDHANNGVPSAPSSNLDEDTPTAPSMTEEPGNGSLAPSAPTLVQTFQSPECVICLERKVNILYDALQIIGMKIFFLFFKTSLKSFCKNIWFSIANKIMTFGS